MGIFDRFKRTSESHNVIEDYELGNIIYRKVNEHLWLSPYDAERYFKFGKIDAQLLKAGTEDEETKRFLPGLSISEEVLGKKILAVEAGIGISYLITFDNFPVGMIDITPPKTNKFHSNMNMWTFDFYITNDMRNKGIMSACFPAFLKLLAHNIGIKEIYAWVHEDNTRSIYILEKFFFRVVDTIPISDPSKRPIITPQYKAWKCPLQELMFYDTHFTCPANWADRPTFML